MFVIPMAGASRRFAEAGYGAPKYMLPLHGRTVFDAAVGSFARYFGERSFLFVARGDAEVEGFVRARCAALGIADVTVVLLPDETAGQAETVERGISVRGVNPAEPLTIFNIDTFRPGYIEPTRHPEIAGWLEVFRGGGANWSYVRPAADGDRIVAETAEKRPISDLCCTGLYHFARADDFAWALGRERRAPQAGELYVAPLYNHLIGRGQRIGYEMVGASEVIFCGVPAEYRALLAAD